MKTKVLYKLNDDDGYRVGFLTWDEEYDRGYKVTEHDNSQSITIRAIKEIIPI